MKSFTIYPSVNDSEKKVLLKLLLENKEFSKRIKKARSFLMTKELNKLDVIKDSERYFQIYKDILEEVGEISNNFNLDISWKSMLVQLVTTGIITNATQNIELDINGNDEIKILISGSRTSKNELLKWVNTYWPFIEKEIKIRYKKTLKRVPQLQNLDLIKEIVKLKTESKQSNREIAEYITKHFNHIVDEDAIKTFYQNYKDLPI